MACFLLFVRLFSGMFVWYPWEILVVKHSFLFFLYLFPLLLSSSSSLSSFHVCVERKTKQNCVSADQIWFELLMACLNFIDFSGFCCYWFSDGGGVHFFPKCNRCILYLHQMCPLFGLSSNYLVLSSLSLLD